MEQRLYVQMKNEKENEFALIRSKIVGRAAHSKSIALRVG